MATLVPQDVSTAGVVPTYAAATSGGDQFANDGKTMVHVKNGGTTTTVTVASQQACSQGATHNTAVAVTSGGERMIGPFDTSRYSDSGGNVLLTYSAVTSLTIGVFQG